MCPRGGRIGRLSVDGPGQNNPDPSEGPWGEGFVTQVALPAAGYDYNSDWTPLLAGLSPAKMATSLAAPVPVM
jgi:hypothetical protein